MNYYSTQITNLIDELRRLPGIGSKSAQRLAFHIINMPEEHVHHLAQTLVTAREKIRYCKYCCTLTDSEVCPICASTKRDHSTIMVVEQTYTGPGCLRKNRSVSWCLSCSSGNPRSKSWKRSR